MLLAQRIQFLAVSLSNHFHSFTYGEFGDIRRESPPSVGVKVKRFHVASENWTKSQLISHSYETVQG